MASAPCWLLSSTRGRRGPRPAFRLRPCCCPSRSRKAFLLSRQAPLCILVCCPQRVAPLGVAAGAQGSSGGGPPLRGLDRLVITCNRQETGFGGRPLLWQQLSQLSAGQLMECPAAACKYLFGDDSRGVRGQLPYTVTASESSVLS